MQKEKIIIIGNDKALMPAHREMSSPGNEPALLATCTKGDLWLLRAFTKN